MALLPKWLKTNVSTNFESRIKATFDSIVTRLSQIGDGFTAIDTNITLNANQTSVFTGMFGGPARWTIGTTTIGATDFMVVAYMGNTAYTVALPSAADYPNRMVCIKRWGLDPSRTLLVVGTVDVGTLTMTTVNASYVLMATSNTWVVMSNY